MKRHGSPIGYGSSNVPLPPDRSDVGATDRKRIGLAVFALPRVLYGMDLTVLNLTAPSFTADLQSMAAQLL
jgi:hypothetical protein